MAATRPAEGEPPAGSPGDRLRLPDQVRGHVLRLAGSPRNRNADPDLLQQARSYVVEQVEAAGWQVRLDEFATPAGLGVTDAGHGPGQWFPLRVRGPVAGTNIVATRGGRPVGAGTLLVLAHLDSVRSSPGAYDNASGVAAVLAAAAQIPVPTGDRDVALVLVDLEEISLAGSRHLARTLTPVAVVNLESVGYYDDRPGSQRLPPGLGMLAKGLAAQVRAGGSAGNFAMVVHRADSALIAVAWADAAEQVGLRTVLHQDNRYTGPGWHVERIFDPVGANLDRSDHAPFWNAGVPAVMVTDTVTLRSPHYHRPTDTPDTLDYRRLAAVAAATVHLATRWQSTDLLAGAAGP